MSPGQRAPRRATSAPASSTLTQSTQYGDLELLVTSPHLLAAMKIGLQYTGGTGVCVRVDAGQPLD